MAWLIFIIVLIFIHNGRDGARRLNRSWFHNIDSCDKEVGKTFWIPRESNPGLQHGKQALDPLRHFLSARVRGWRTKFLARLGWLAKELNVQIFSTRNSSGGLFCVMKMIYCIVNENLNWVAYYFHAGLLGAISRLTIWLGPHPGSTGNKWP